MSTMEAVLTGESLDSKKLIVTDQEPVGFECLNFFGKHWVCLLENVEDITHIGVPVLYVEPNSPVHATCAYTLGWHLSAISGMPAKWPYYHQIRRRPISKRVYVLDTQVDCGHPDLAGHCEVAYFDTGLPHPHGTHVAGIVAGARTGVSPNVHIVSVPVLDENGQGAWWLLLKALEWTSRQTPAVINLSLSGPRSEAVNTALRLMVEKGWRVAAAAGNEGQNACNVSPGSEPLVVTVAASNQENSFSTFSNHGGCVDVVAPGESILSTIPGGRYGGMSGTSMASPIVAGMMARGDMEWLRDYVTEIPPGTKNRFAVVSDRDVCPKIILAFQ